jgi:hypothetical protein
MSESFATLLDESLETLDMKQGLYCFRSSARC